MSWILEHLPGRVGITFAPGKKAASKYSHSQWDRDLAMDLDTLVKDGMHTLVTLLDDAELAALEIPALIAEATARGVHVRRLPIADMGVPDLADVVPLVDAVLATARSGKGVVLHCMGGLGRAGTIGGCVLVGSGMTSTEAIVRLRERRGPNCPENEAQRDLIRAFARARGRT